MNPILVTTATLTIAEKVVRNIDIVDALYGSVQPKYQSSLSDKEIAQDAKDEHVENSEKKLRKQLKKNE